MLSKPLGAAARLFLLSFCLTLVVVATVWGFIVVHRHMQQMGMAPVGQSKSLLITQNLSPSPTYLSGIELARRPFDTLTLPRAARLFIKLYFFIDHLIKTRG